MNMGDDVWHALYEDASEQAETYRVLAHRKELRVIALESQRRTLLAQLRQAAVDLKARGSIEVAQQYLNTVVELEAGYVEQGKGTFQPARATSSATEVGSTDSTGSGAVPATAQELESPQGIPVSHRSPGTYAGEWDAVSK